MSRIKDVSNIKNFVDTIDEISSDVDTNLNTIKGNLTELGISSSAFNKTNLINGLRNDPTIAPINTTDHKGDVEKVSSNSYIGMPLNASLLKLGVSGRDPEDPATIITSNNNSRTLTTDRKDQNTTTVKRWATRCVFKFRSQDYGYDRCVYEIPTQYLMEGCVGTEGRHATTFSKYPYPEEIIMISADNDKNFIHFVNAQYLDGHYNYYNGTAYNLMIVKDRTNWGVLNDAGTEFKKYISVYANNVEDSLAFYIEDNSGIGYVTFPMPDRSFGDELLNTLWDCKVIWRSDAPDRDFNITVEGEYREEYVNEIDPTWTQGNMHSNIRWSSVCYGNGKYVAVSNSTTMAYSSDGINWTQGTMPISRSWSSVCYGNGKYVAVADNTTSNTMAYSTDGISWTQGNMPTVQSWSSVCYGNGKYVAVSNSTTMAYSSDGINWTQGTLPSYGYWTSVCYGNGNGRYVAMGGSNITAYSSDGISWSQGGNMPNSQDWHSVCYGNGKYIAVANTKSTIMAYSTDGISWTSGTMPSSQIWHSVCYGNGTYVAVVGNIHTNIFAYSSDGISWTEGNMTFYQIWYSVCYGNSKFVAVGSNTAMAYLPDSEFSSLKFKESSISASSNQYWHSVCYGNGKYVAVAGNNSNIMAYSTDGISWTQGNMPSRQNWISVCYGNDKYVAVASDTNIMAYSTDGIRWTQGTMPSSQYWNSVCYGNGKFVAVCTSNIMAYSTDGIRWTQGTMPSSRNWESVCYGNGKFVAVCTSNIMAYSTDGISWTEGNMPSEQRWYSVCYGNGKFVATAGSTTNIMAYSTDGIEWTQSNMPSDQYWHSVCYGNGKYVAVAGNNSNIMAYSTDGISWTQGNMPSRQNWISVCYGNDKYVAVASDTKIAYALSDYLFHPLFDLDKINGRAVLTEESNTRLARIRDTFDNFLEMNGKLTQVNHSTLTDYNNSKLNLYQLPEYNEYLSVPGFGGRMDKLISWNDYYIYLGYNPNENGLNTTVLNKSLSIALNTSIYPTDFDTNTNCVYFGGITINENTPTKFSFDFIEFGNNINGQWEYNVIHITYAKDSETGELTYSLLPAPDHDTVSTKVITGACQITNDKYLVFSDTSVDLITVGDTVTVQQNYGTKVKSSLLTHYGMVSIPNNAATIEANTNVSFSDCGDEIFSNIQSGNLYSYDDQSRYSDDVTGYEANDEGKALTAFDTGVFTTSTGKDLLLRAKLKFTFTSDFTLA